MKKLVLAATLAVAAIAPIGAAQACGEEPLATYSTTLGGRDHFNSNGQRLTSIGQILQQDRANVNSRNIRDAGDQGDGYFTSVTARGQIAEWIEAGWIDDAARARIMEGSGAVTVYVYDGWIEVVPA
ncbi:MAG: hypothetical protein H7X93_08140 [Sphingomonadaceae bacterium]|nr:hypothetical protein [Sphingomonadaceae bacterium]